MVFQIMSFINYFTEDPLKLLTLIGGSGGVLYWVNLIKNRIRVKIRVKEIKPYSFDGKAPSITFEAENLGGTPTSIEPYIVLKGYIPPIMKKEKTSRFKKTCYSYEIDSLRERHLPPRDPKKIFAQCNSVDDEFKFLKLCIYNFKLTLGGARKIRTKSIGGPEVNILKYNLLKAIYLISNNFYIKRFVG